MSAKKKSKDPKKKLSKKHVKKLEKKRASKREDVAARKSGKKRDGVAVHKVDKKREKAIRKAAKKLGKNLSSCGGAKKGKAVEKGKPSKKSSRTKVPHRARLHRLSSIWARVRAAANVARFPSRNAVKVVLLHARSKSV